MGENHLFNFFTYAVKCYRAEKILLVFSFCLMILCGVFQLQLLSTGVCIVCVIFQLALQYNRMYFQGKADENRRRDFIDNSYGVTLGMQQTEGYYDNEEQDCGLYKALLNVFENSFFSSNIARTMFVKIKKRSTLLIVITIIFMSTGILQNDVSLFLLSLFLMIRYVRERLILKKYMDRVSKLYASIENMFQEGLVESQVHEKSFEALVIHILIEYETNIAENKILLDSKLFDTMNDELTDKWRSMKKKYKITE